MNQDSFRKLLTTPRPGLSPIPPHAVGQSTKKPTLNVSEPAFQPRQVKKKTNSEYRDRASERRAGVNDYAEVESVLEDFEKKMATIENRDAVEEQRRYLGGDKYHTILVKGLDFALLEQNKARAMLSHEDDESLEAAFQEAQPKSLVPVKRTREDLIRELKEKRASRPSTDVVIQHPVGDKTFEEAKKVGKFRPIGAPDHLTAHEIRKRPKGKEHDKADGGDRKKKRRRVKHNMVTTEKHHNGAPRPQAAVSVSSSEAHIVSTLLPQNVSTDTQDGLDTPKVPVLEHISLKNPDDEVDIFVDAGEYEGVDFGEDEDEEHGEGQTLGNVNPEEHMMLDPKSDGAAPVKSWFIEDEPPSVLDSSQDAPPSTPPIKEEPASAEPEEPEHKSVNRLVPLASSALPSIGDFLAMDAEAEAQQKRKAKKEKRTGREKKDTERTDVKVDRDYKRLNSYLSKKGDGSKGI